MVEFMRSLKVIPHSASKIMDALNELRLANSGWLSNGGKQLVTARGKPKM